MTDVRAMFESFDEDENGSIDLGEFRKLVGTLGLELDAAGAEALFDAIDTDETGLIDADEFVAWWEGRAT